MLYKVVTISSDSSQHHQSVMWGKCYSIHTYTCMSFINEQDDAEKECYMHLQSFFFETHYKFN
jgi:hypothetical protein